MLDKLDFRSGIEAKPDTLTDEERAAIDAFPPEKIQRVPQGVSGLGPAEYEYHGQRLIMVDPITRKPLGRDKALEAMRRRGRVDE